MDKLFNKFVRGDGIARIHPDGSGLGLFIAKKIVESHGGRIWVESEGDPAPVASLQCGAGGKGSTFAFAIPVREGEQPSASKATLTSQKTVVHSKERRETGFVDRPFPLLQTCGSSPGA